MRNWTFGRRLFTGVGALVVLIVAVAALALFVGRSLEESLIETDDHLVGREQEALQAGLEGAKSRTSMVRAVVFAGVFVSIVIAGFVVRSVGRANRSLRSQSQELRENTEHVVAAAAQVATSAQSLSR